MNDCFWCCTQVCEGEDCDSCAKYLSMNSDEGCEACSVYEKDVAEALVPLRAKYKQMMNSF